MRRGRREVVLCGWWRRRAARLVRSLYLHDGRRGCRHQTEEARRKKRAAHADDGAPPSAKYLKKKGAVVGGVRRGGEGEARGARRVRRVCVRVCACSSLTHTHTLSEIAPAAKVPTNPPSSQRKRQRAAVAIGKLFASCRYNDVQSCKHVRTIEQPKYDAAINQSAGLRKTC